MSQSIKCPQCGSELPPDFPPGICPACLMKQGLHQSHLSGLGPASSQFPGGNRRGWIPPTPEQLAPHFPQLEIQDLLGQGGMGAVYKVRQRDLGRLAALKILPDEVAQDPTFAERFQREARALAQLGHQHIVIVYEFGQRDGIYFLLMEYIDGVTLRQAIRNGQVSAKDALGIVMQICDALQFAHEEGVVHRDIKPENILIDRRGRVKIADFGLAKLLGSSGPVPTLTGTHQVMGTPMYMAPEQMEGTRGVDHRADIFSLGVVFYELLTGELPLGRFAPPSQKYSLDIRLDEVVLKTLEKEPDRRYQQASDVKTDVESIRGRPVAQARPGETEPMRSFRMWPSRRSNPPSSQSRSNSGSGLGRFIVRVVIGVLIGFPLVIVSALVVMVLTYRAASRQEIPAMTKSAYNPAVERVMPPILPASNQVPFDLLPRDANEIQAIVQFPDGIPQLNPEFGNPILTAEHRKILQEIFERFHQRYLDAERQFTEHEFQSNGSQVTRIAKFQAPFDVAEIENQFWTEIDSKLPLTQQHFLRQTLPLYVDELKPLPRIDQGGSPMMPGLPGTRMGMGPAAGGAASMGAYPPQQGGYPLSGLAKNYENLRYNQILGFQQSFLPLQVLISPRGKWFHWEIRGFLSSGNDGFVLGEPVDSGDAPTLPSGLKRFWRNSPGQQVQPLIGPSPQVEKPHDNQVSTIIQKKAESEVVDELDSWLKRLENLRRGRDTDFAFVEKTTELALEAFKANPQKIGRIHWQAAHVYGQSGIDKTFAQVIHHAKEALKYERDPINRGWLYMYLGDASQVSSSDPKAFVERRSEATRWHIKGYAELLAFQLPDVAPELPGVDKLARENSDDPSGDNQREQLASEVHHAAQMKARVDAEFTTELVRRRDTYILSLRDMFIRLHQLYDQEADAKVRLRELATPILKNPDEVGRLIDRVWQQQPQQPANF